MEHNNINECNTRHVTKLLQRHLNRTVKRIKRTATRFNMVQRETTLMVIKRDANYSVQFYLFIYFFPPFTPNQLPSLVLPEVSFCQKGSFFLTVTKRLLKEICLIIGVFYILLQGLPYNIKHLGATVLVNLSYINETELD